MLLVTQMRRGRKRLGGGLTGWRGIRRKAIVCSCQKDALSSVLMTTWSQTHSVRLCLFLLFTFVFFVSVGLVLSNNSSSTLCYRLGKYFCFLWCLTQVSSLLWLKLHLRAPLILRGSFSAAGTDGTMRWYNSLASSHFPFRGVSSASFSEAKLQQKQDNWDGKWLACVPDWITRSEQCTNTSVVNAINSEKHKTLLHTYYKYTYLLLQHCSN